MYKHVLFMQAQLLAHFIGIGQASMLFVFVCAMCFINFRDGELFNYLDNRDYFIGNN